jgi:2',3'-cyclic-nucleotide 2'-phosphodiesterase (5'-nucleotidase family)
MSEFRAAFAALGGAAILAACVPAAPSFSPAPQPVKRGRIVHTNDLHGRLLPQAVGGRAAGGAALLAAHFDSAAARFDGPAIFISAGDDLQGTMISNLSWGRATIDALNAAGYDAAVFGNHEFDWGVDTLGARVRESRFPWLAANVYRAGTTEHPDWVRPWVVIERGGVRTAVVGAALSSTARMVAQGRTAGLDFGPEAPAIDRAVREARAAGADFVVLAMHVGVVCETPGAAPEEASTGCRGDALEIVRGLEEPVDLVLAGHTHARVLLRDGVPVLEAASYGTQYSVADLERDAEPARATHLSVRVAWADSAAPDPQVVAVVGGWEARVAPLAGRVVATLAEPMADASGGRTGEFPLGILVAEAQRAAAGAEVGVVNNSAVRRALPAGPATYGMLFELQPFQNELVRVEVTGAQLRSVLESALSPAGEPDAQLAGMVVDYAPGAPAGSRICAIRLADGTVVSDETRVSLASTDFMVGSSRYSMLRETTPVRLGVLDVDAVVQYLAGLPQPVRPPATGAWRLARGAVACAVGLHGARKSLRASRDTTEDRGPAPRPERDRFPFQAPV